MIETATGAKAPSAALQGGGAFRPLTVTVDRACQLTGLGRTSIYELIKQQKLKTVAIGRRRLVIYSSLEQLLGGRKGA